MYTYVCMCNLRNPFSSGLGLQICRYLSPTRLISCAVGPVSKCNLSKCIAKTLARIKYFIKSLELLFYHPTLEKVLFNEFLTRHAIAWGDIVRDDVRTSARLSVRDANVRRCMLSADHIN